MTESLSGPRLGLVSVSWYFYAVAGDGRRTATGRVLARTEEEARHQLRRLSRGGSRLTISRRPFAGVRM